ncbi:MAG: class F sortase [Candidatus Saccharimonadales bacterium]
MNIAKLSRWKRRQIRALLAAILVGSIAAGLTIYILSKNTASIRVTPGSIYQLATQKTQPIVPSLPVRLLIPNINVNAAIEQMGLTPEGDMDSPDSPDNTGWYRAGPRPGEIGNAVIDGHFGWKNAKPAVFDKLHTLKKGDLVLVEDESKNSHTFVVTEIRFFGPDDDATEVFQSTDNRAHLNLITCQGVWNKDLRSYSTRLVVFADLRD